jgi:actin-related protein 2
MDNSRPCIILDNGTGYLKCGMSNFNIPQYTLPALVGRPLLRSGETIENFELKVEFI